MREGLRQVLHSLCGFYQGREFDVLNVVSRLRTARWLTGPDEDRIVKAETRTIRCKILFIDILPNKEKSVIDDLNDYLIHEGNHDAVEKLRQLINDEKASSEKQEPTSSQESDAKNQSANFRVESETKTKILQEAHYAISAQSSSSNIHFTCNKSTELLEAVIEGWKPSDFEDWKVKFVNQLGNEPLAVQLAGSYIKQTQCSIDDYSAKLKKTNEKILKKGLQFNGPRQVLTTASVTLKYLKKKHPNAFKFLTTCSFLSTKIDDDILFSSRQFKTGSPQKTKELVEEAKTQLFKYSVLNSMLNGVEIYTLLQESILIILSDEDRVSGFFNGASGLKDIYDKELNAGREKFETCLTHSKAMLNNFHRHVDYTRCLNSSAQSDSLQRTLQRSYRMTNELFFGSGNKLEIKEDKSFLLQIFETAKVIFGTKIPNSVAVNIAVALGNDGDHETEREMLKDSLDKLISSNNRVDNLEVAETRIKLARCYGSFNDRKGMVEMLDNASNFDESAYDEKITKIAAIFNDAGECYEQLGEYVKMKAILERASRVIVVADEANPVVTRTWSNFAAYHRALKEYDEEEKILQKLLEIQKKFWCPEVGKTFKKLGYCYEALNRLPESIEYFKKAIDCLEGNSQEDSNQPLDSATALRRKRQYSTSPSFLTKPNAKNLKKIL